MDKLNDIEGKLVSEEEVSKGLGFASVEEFRRWRDIELVKENTKLKYELRLAKDESEGFRWHLKRALTCLEKIGKKLGYPLEPHDYKEISKAIAIISGKDVDWGSSFEKKGWFG